MKAIRYETFGPPEALQLREVAKPLPQPHQVLVKVHAASINAKEWRRFEMPSFLVRLLTGGWTKPKDPVIGADVAGIVEAVGETVTRFKPGDAVFGCAHGSLAEYVLAREAFLTLKPANRSFEEAAVPLAALTAIQAIRYAGGIRAWQQVLIQGASGGVGTFAVQIAKAFGAEVTAVCSTRNVELIRSLGADHIIDYTKEDFTHNGKRYDLLLDIAGSRPWRESKRVLTPSAHYVIVGAPKGNQVIGPLGFIIKTRLGALGASQKVIFFVANFKREDFLLLKDMFERGQVKPVVEKSYPLEKISEAMRHLGTGHAQGKIVVTMK